MRQGRRRRSICVEHRTHASACVARCVPCRDGDRGARSRSVGKPQLDRQRAPGQPDRRLPLLRHQRLPRALQRGGAADRRRLLPQAAERAHAVPGSAGEPRRPVLALPQTGRLAPLLLRAAILHLKPDGAAIDDVGGVRPHCGRTEGFGVIIEWHTHVYPPEEAAADARTFDGRSGPTWAGRCPMTVENVLDAHHKAGIDISLVSNAAHYLRGKAERDELAAIRRWTDYAAEIQHTHAGTLYALATILPCGGAAYLKEVERAIL